MMNLKELTKGFVINDLCRYESLIYEAIADRFATYSISMSFKYLGHFIERLEIAYLNDNVITLDEFKVYNDYVKVVLMNDCYSNMHSRMQKL